MGRHPQHKRAKWESEVDTQGLQCVKGILVAACSDGPIEPIQIPYSVAADACGVAFATSDKFADIAKLRSDKYRAVILPGHKIKEAELVEKGLTASKCQDLRMPLLDPVLKVYQEKQAQLLNLGSVPVRPKIEGATVVPAADTRELYCELSDWCGTAWKDAAQGGNHAY